MRWIARLEEAPLALREPLAWIAPHRAAADWPLPPASAEDRADAALARRDGGAPRLLRRRLLRALVGRVFGLHPDGVRFTRDEAGRPGLLDLPAHISTAGCQGFSAVALSPTPVGIDLEALSEGGDLLAWTALEAGLKANGRGLEGRFEAGPSWTLQTPDYVATLALSPPRLANAPSVTGLRPAPPPPLRRGGGER